MINTVLERRFAQSREKGLTLVELAIVIMIIGLLLAGILKGQELIENARVKSTLNQVNAIEAAVTTFRDTYNAFPGDFSLAADAAGRIANCTAANQCYNGTGDGIIGAAGGLGTAQVAPAASAAGEPANAWKQLLFADLISGVTNNNTIAWGETFPSAPLGGGFMIGHGNGGAGGTDLGVNGHHISLSPTAGAALNQTVGVQMMTPGRAAQIDARLDDRIPDEGYVVGQGVAANCQTAYNEQVESDDCNLFFRIQN